MWSEQAFVRVEKEVSWMWYSNWSLGIKYRGFIYGVGVQNIQYLYTDEGRDREKSNLELCLQCIQLWLNLREKTSTKELEVQGTECRRVKVESLKTPDCYLGERAPELNFMWLCGYYSTFNQHWPCNSKMLLWSHGKHKCICHCNMYIPHV